MKYLINTTETYRVDTEEEAKELIESAKAERIYSLTKYSSEYKEVKSKGEVVDDYFKVTLVKSFNSIKEPDSSIAVIYGFEVEGNADA